MSFNAAPILPSDIALRLAVLGGADNVGLEAFGDGVILNKVGAAFSGGFDGGRHACVFAAFHDGIIGDAASRAVLKHDAALVRVGKLVAIHSTVDAGLEHKHVILHAM